MHAVALNVTALADVCDEKRTESRAGTFHERPLRIRADLLRFAVCLDQSEEPPQPCRAFGQVGGELPRSGA
jgi:hypothetical protein